MVVRTRTITTAMGPATEFSDFPTKEVPIYCHRPVRDSNNEVIHEVGSVVYIKRVGDPRTLSPSEKVWFLEKSMSYGWFPYKPGKECLAHEYVPVRRGENNHLFRRPAQMGCDDCRTSSQTEEQTAGAAEVPQAPSIASAASPDASGGVEAGAVPPASASTPVAQCPYCGWQTKAKTDKRGKAALKRHLSSCEG